jgi:hypothetical protein
MYCVQSITEQNVEHCFTTHTMQTPSNAHPTTTAATHTLTDFTVTHASRSSKL